MKWRHNFLLLFKDPLCVQKRHVKICLSSWKDDQVYDNRLLINFECAGVQGKMKNDFSLLSITYYKMVFD